jgi:RNA polymerase sigma-70 factor (ECF subfamily)
MTDRTLEFQPIHDTYRPRLVRYLARLVGTAEAEDLTQQVLLKISGNLGQFRGESSLSTWIYRIATNAAMDQLRHPHARSMQGPACAATPADTDLDRDAEDVWAEASIPSVETSVMREEMSQCVRDFVDRLPDNYKSVIVLSELEGFKNSEIGDILGISLDAVKIRLHRAREKLRQDLSAGCSFDRDQDDEFTCDRKA